MLALAEVAAAKEVMRISSYVALPIFALGLIGNGIMIRLMIKREVRQYASSVFLLGLAITDTIILIYEIMDDIAIHIPNITAHDILYGYNSWRCRFGVFFYQTAKTISAWLVVGMAAELCVAAWNPNKRKVLYYRNRTLYVSMAIVLVAIAAGFPFLVLTQEADPKSEMPACTSVYQVFFLVYSEFVLKGATQCLIPLILIIVCNLISFCAMSRQKEQRRQGEKYMSTTDRRGGTTIMPTQANNTIYVLTILYVLTVTPATAAEVFIMVQRFLGDFAYTELWNIVINTTGLIFIVNYALKFYFIVLFGKQYRGAFAGKLDLYDEGDDDVTPIANGAVPVANGTYDSRYVYN